MHLTSEQVRAHIENRTISAISLDTSVFDHAGRRLEHGILPQLHAIGATRIRFVLPDVVFRELEAHLLEDVGTSLQRAKSGLKGLRAHWPDAPNILQEGIASIVPQGNGAAIVSHRLRTYLQSVRATVVPASNNVQIQVVLDQYFSRQAPFGAGKKKSEFPDAIALGTLETWAATNNTSVLVVSRDAGWATYCAASPRLVCMSDLAEALACCQTQIAIDLADGISQELARGGFPGFAESLEASLNAQMDLLTVHGEFDSVFEGEADAEVTSVDVVEIADLATGSALAPLSFEGGRLTARVQALCTVGIEGTVTFHTWDSIDKEHVSMGSDTVSGEASELLSAIVKIRTAATEPWEVESVELEPATFSIDFGHIVPTWMRDPPDLDDIPLIEP